MISSKDKLSVTDEFKALENDIELRRKGIARYALDLRSNLVSKITGLMLRAFVGL